MRDATPFVTTPTPAHLKEFQQIDGFDPFQQLLAQPPYSQQEHCANGRALAKQVEGLQTLNASLSDALYQERKARLEAEEISHKKDQLLATVSHELRTPLTAILGWLQILRKEKVDPRMVHGFEIIERNAQVQNRLIEDLLDVVRIKTGKVRINKILVRLLSIVDEVIETLRPSAEAKDIELRRYSGCVDDFVLGDPFRLRQIIWNLLANAIKFTPGGGRVLVQVELAGCTIETKINDTGAGINADFLPHIFEPFRQCEDAISGNGLGLGLAVVRHLVELHGGEVHAASSGEGHGSCFTVSLPVMTSHPTAAGSSNEICTNL